MQSLAKLLIAAGVFCLAGAASAGASHNSLSAASPSARPICECHIVNGTVVCTCIKR